jgi:hypothetical protein
LLRKTADCLPINLCDARNFVLALPGRQKREYRGLQMWLQDVHSLLPSKIEERRLRPAENSPDSAENGALVHRYALIRVGDFDRPSGRSKA